MKDKSDKIDFEKLDTADYREHYSEKGFWNKVKSVARRGGDKVLYYAYMLYYVMLSKEVPIKKKAVICGALGYFILPSDMIPDFIVGLGFTDDLAVLTLAYKAIESSITPKIKSLAEERLGKSGNRTLK